MSVLKHFTQLSRWKTRTNLSHEQTRRGNRIKIHLTRTNVKVVISFCKVHGERRQFKLPAHLLRHPVANVSCQHPLIKWKWEKFVILSIYFETQNSGTFRKRSCVSFPPVIRCPNALTFRQ